MHYFIVWQKARDTDPSLKQYMNAHRDAYNTAAFVGHTTFVLILRESLKNGWLEGIGYTDMNFIKEEWAKPETTLAVIQDKCELISDFIFYNLGQGDDKVYSIGLPAREEKLGPNSAHVVDKLSAVSHTRQAHLEILRQKLPPNSVEISKSMRAMVSYLVDFYVYSNILISGRCGIWDLLTSMFQMLVTTVHCTGQFHYQWLLLVNILKYMSSSHEDLSVFARTFVVKLKNDSRYLFSDEMQELVNLYFQKFLKTHDVKKMENKCMAMPCLLEIDGKLSIWSDTGNKEFDENKEKQEKSFADDQTAYRMRLRTKVVRYLLNRADDDNDPLFSFLRKSVADNKLYNVDCLS